MAVETPDADLGFYGLMALIGLYVGVIPVAIGMLWLPWLRSVDPRWRRASCWPSRVGLLAFLGIDALLEGTRVRRRRARRRSAARRWSGWARRWPTWRWRASTPGCAAARSATVGRVPWRLAFLVALGIGLHNLGEGLAIGSAYAIGSLALGAALVVGFALHNTTEGLAIVAPVAAREKVGALRRLAGLGLLAGAPAVLGAWIGASAFTPEPRRRSCSASARARSPR